MLWAGRKSQRAAGTLSPGRKAQARRHTRKDPWYETSKSHQPTAFSGCLENTFQFNVLGAGADIEPAVSPQEGDVWKCWAPWCQRDDRIMEEHRPWRGRDQPSKSRITWLTRCKTATTHRGLYPQESSGSRSSSGQDEEPADKGILHLITQEKQPAK